ncbi:PRC and DUF2382 domain-containing protein [Prauserella oleivorans]|uniref:PRC and DUF2382 domain-containing protein n=1 Tax=Prauserella oleivorans TaxID=1478153 RepID=A0ABW5W6I7_9PSEU
MASWHGKTVYDAAGQKIGKVGQLWADDDDGSPTWVTVQTGLFGTSESFIPVQGMRSTGDDLQTSYDKETVKDAPNLDPSRGHIDESEQSRLYSHYGLADIPGQPAGEHDQRQTKPEEQSGVAGTTVGDSSTAGAAAGETTPGPMSGQSGRGTTAGREATGHDVSGPTTDDAMTVSEERLRVGKQRQEAGRARLRKYVYTETQSVDVPVTREEVRVEREPITDANRDAAMSGPAISEEEHEVTLHEERPVVETEAVPVERVRLAKEEVTDTETVSGDVRKERVDTGEVEGRYRD